MGFTPQPIGNTWITKRKPGETYAQHRARALATAGLLGRLATLGVVILILTVISIARVHVPDQIEDDPIRDQVIAAKLAEYSGGAAVKCGKKHCTEPGHVCPLCVNNDLANGRMPAECGPCGIESCGFEPKFKPIQEGANNG